MDKEFEKLSEEILEWRWEVSPLEATFRQGEGLRQEIEPV